MAFGAFVLVLLWLGLGFNLGRERAFAIHVAEADTANLARAFEEHVNRTIAGLDQTLQFVKAEYERDPAGFSLKASAVLSLAPRSSRMGLALADASGTMVDSTLGGPSGINVSDREYFRFQRHATADHLFIGQPMVGRISGTWVIMLTRRLSNADGSFAGTLSITLDPDYLSGFYNSIDIGSKGAILLLGRDGVVRAGSNVSASEWTTAPGLAGAIFEAGVGTAEMEGPFDQETRISSFRTLKGLPLAVWVGRAKSDVLARSALTEKGYLLVGLGVTALLLAALLLVFRVVRGQEIIAHDLAVKKAELTANRERLRRYVADLERIAEVAAHDLQEPLRRVVAYAQLLSVRAQSALDAESRDYAAHVVAGAHRMRKLVKDLEAFVAVDNLPLPTATVPAGIAMKAAAEQLAEEVRRSGASLLVEPLPEVAVDEKSLTEIFAQLLDNGLRYRNPERRTVIHVSAQWSGDHVVFSVHDNGMGIEESHLARAFEIFHRLPGLDGHKGTGMGLAIVRRIVERHGGRVWVETQAGAGSTFMFSLPTIVQVPVEDGQEAQAA